LQEEEEYVASLGGSDMKRSYCLALVILLIIAGILANFAVGEGPVVLPGYKPTYTPNTNYITPEPIQVGKFSSQKPTQLSLKGNTETNGESQITAPSSAQIQVGFGIVGDSNEPILGAQLTGDDGSSNSFQEFTDSDGYAAITGFPGKWQLTAYAQGYFSKTLNRPFSSNTYVALILQKIGSQPPLEPEGVTPYIIGRENISDCDLNRTVELNGNLTTNQSSMDDPWMDGSPTDDPWLEGA
jgi:hypothetical protein